ncbi:ATP-dependent DNA helicase RecG [Candidatus Poribacteria bacterium]|nr:ATP-dependent DNA helicase RecG [Candidatus Poribacteria bacterium]
MNDLKQVLSILSRPFQQELRMGCQDDVVVNGMCAYVEIWIGHARELELTNQEKQLINHIADRFKNYTNISPTERKIVIENTTNQINSLLTSRVISYPPSTTQKFNTQETTQKKLDQKTENDKPSSAISNQFDNLPLFQNASNPQHTSTSEDISSQPNLKPEITKNTPKSSILPFEVIPKTQTDPVEREEDAPVTLDDIPVTTDVESLEIFNNPLQYVKGIGPRRSEILEEEIKISTVGGLLEYYPRDYIDRSKIIEIYNVGRTEDGEPETIQGKVVNHVTTPPVAKGRKSIGKVSIYDGTGVAILVNFGRRIGYINSILPIDTEVVISGRFTRRYNEIQTTDYEFEIFDEDNLIHTKRIVPKYSLTKKLTAKMIRTAVSNTLDEYGSKVPEILPLQLRQKNQLIDRQKAINEIHFPSSENHRRAAQRRLAFDEFFLLSLGMEMRKDTRTSQNGIQFQIDTNTQDSGSLLQRFNNSLPFNLTDAQKRVFSEIKDDMQSKRVMNRLIQGDVGSGKTVVAAMALLSAIQNGYQGAIMVPTEILAEQHHQNLSAMLSALEVKVVLLKSDLSKSDREDALAAISDGSADLIVGTQALIQEGVDFHKLGLVIIDEQHRFGVMQRATLRSKAKSSSDENSNDNETQISPDVLVMTATPIPRTLSLTIYGDLNISVIDELPPGRQKIETRWVKEKDRADLYAKIEREIRQGKQAYIVYPLVEESEKLEELKAATSMAEHIQKDVFPQLRVGLLHGQMKSIEKQEIMTKFNARELDILVATTVIEVGIDVPNATLMVIENAERFGLAQLHQLRGRVGRGSDKSFCYLVATPRTDDSYRRIQVMVRSNNGFDIAEEDLNIRGPGEFFGTRQSGIPTFKIANIISDAALLESAKKEAELLIKQDPKLNQPEHQLMKRMLTVHWKGHLEIASVG